MKSKRSWLPVLALLTLFLFMQSCEKEKIDVADLGPAIQEAVTVTYSNSPAIGSYAMPYSSGSVQFNGVTYNGGTIRASITSRSGRNVTIGISKTAGTVFTTGGTFELHAGSPGGPLLATSWPICFSGLQFHLSFTVPEFGFTNIFAVFRSDNGSNFFASPVQVYSSPLFNPVFGSGNILGHVDGVTTYSNGTTNYSPTGYYQCVEFAKRYCQQVLGLGGYNLTGNANQWFPTASQRGLTAYANGTTLPKAGDVITFSGGPYGHIAVIYKVTSTAVSIAHQNWPNTKDPIGWNLTRSGNSIQTGVSGWTVQGLLRRQ
jgi:surface antigen